MCLFLYIAVYLGGSSQALYHKIKSNYSVQAPLNILRESA